MAKLSERELDILAYTLLGEAGGEGRSGMQAVMHVIMNRAESGRFPSNLAAVATQSNAAGIHQFSTWNDPIMGGNRPMATYSRQSAAFRRARQIAEEAVAGRSTDPTGGALFFYSTSMDTPPYWWDSEAPLGGRQIGNHIFAQRRTVDAPVPMDRPGQTNPIGNVAKTDKNAPAGKTAEGLAINPVRTVVIDPITGMPVSNGNVSISDKVRFAGEVQTAAQRLAAAKKLSAATPLSTAATSYAGQETSKASKTVPSSMVTKSITDAYNSQTPEAYKAAQQAAKAKRAAATIDQIIKDSTTARAADPNLQTALDKMAAQRRAQLDVASQKSTTFTQSASDQENIVKLGKLGNSSKASDKARNANGAVDFPPALDFNNPPKLQNNKVAKQVVTQIVPLVKPQVTRPLTPAQKAAQIKAVTKSTVQLQPSVTVQYGGPTTTKRQYNPDTNQWETKTVPVKPSKSSSSGSSVDMKKFESRFGSDWRNTSGSSLTG